MGTAPVCSPAPEPSAVSVLRTQTVNMLTQKQIDCQMFLCLRWVFPGSADNCDLESAVLMSPMQIPPQRGEKHAFIKRKRELGGLQWTKSWWLFIGWVFAREEGVSLFFLSSSAVLAGRKSSAFCSPDSIQLKFLFINLQPQSSRKQCYQYCLGGSLAPRLWI